MLGLDPIREREKMRRREIEKSEREKTGSGQVWPGRPADDGGLAAGNDGKIGEKIGRMRKWGERRKKRKRRRKWVVGWWLTRPAMRPGRQRWSPTRVGDRAA